MLEKQKARNLDQEKRGKQKKGVQERHDKNRITYQQMDACDLPEDWENRFHIVFDKGTMDALLSNGKDEDGENHKVKSLLNEVHRVLKPGGTRKLPSKLLGKFLLITGNDTFIVHPYIFDIDWKVEQEPLKRKSKNKDPHSSDFAKLNLTLYILTKT